MLLRKAFVAALVVTAMSQVPEPLSAQSGLDRAAEATEQADAVGAGENSQAPKKLPKGIAKRFGDGTLPPGIERTRVEESTSVESDPEPELEEEEEPDPEIEIECIPVLVIENGWPTLQCV